MTWNTLQSRCLVSSAVAHVAVLVALSLGSAWATRRVLDNEPILPPIEMISMEGVRLTDANGAGGGTPTPPPPQPRTSQPSTPAQAAPPAQPRQATREVRVAPAPVRTAPPEREVRVSPNAVRTQDTEPNAPRATRRPIQVAATSQRVSPAESQASQQAANRAAERAAAAARERAAREASERWRTALGGIRSQLAEGLSGQMDITSPGPGGGGEVWMGYGQYLKAFYEARWRRPSSLPVPVAYVGVAVTVARDGRMTKFELLEKSGVKALDDSVLELVQRYRQLEPLPNGSSDAERTFRIKFRLEGTTQ